MPSSSARPVRSPHAQARPPSMSKILEQRRITLSYRGAARRYAFRTRSLVTVVIASSSAPGHSPALIHVRLERARGVRWCCRSEEPRHERAEARDETRMQYQAGGRRGDRDYGDFGAFV